MKTAIIWVMCTIVVAASALVLTDKVLELVSPQGKAGAAGGRASDAAVLARLHKVEQSLDAIREMLKIPPPEDPNTDPDSREGAEPSAPPQASLGERIQWLDAELANLRRQQNRDLMQIFTRLRRRLDEMEAKLVKDRLPDSRASVDDLKKHGVIYDPAAKLITMEAAFVQPTRVLEFIAVAEGGSGHESLLLLNARPSALKRAIELMGVVEGPDPPYYDQAKIPKESCVYVYVTWPGRKTPIRVERLLKNGASPTGETLPLTPFIFTGSRAFIEPRTWDEHLAADVHKNTIGLTWNYASETVITCPAVEAESEHVWTAVVDLVPPPPTPATIYVSKDPREEWDQP